MYRWNSRVPTVRWKDNCLNDRGTSRDPTEDIVQSNSTNICSKSISNSTNSSISGVATGGNLSGSTLTSCDLGILEKPVEEPPAGVSRCSSTENPVCSFNTNTATKLSGIPPCLSTASGTSTPRLREGTTGNIIPCSPVSPASPAGELVSDESKRRNVIRAFLSLVGTVVREIRTLSLTLLIGLLVNPINYCICYFLPSSSSSSTPSSSLLFSSIRRIVPGGSSSSYYCCKRRNNIIKSSGAGGTGSCPHIRYSCCCTCNCISFLRCIVVGEYCTAPSKAHHDCYKDSWCCSGAWRSWSNFSSFTTSIRAGGSGKPRRLGKMAHILSKTMTLLGVAFVIHFIIMSTFAEREGFLPQPRFSSEDSRKHHYHHHYYHDEEMELGAAARRLARSYRHEKHPTPVPESNALPPLNGHHSRLLTNKSEAVFSTENSTIIIAQIGSKTYLPCAVRNLGSGVASWIRRRDYHLLTVGMGTYSNDDRFMVSHNRQLQSWELHFKIVKPTDEGLYECQISTHPPSSIFVHLRVVEAKAEILGEPDKHVRSGSTFELVCVLRDSTEPPIYVFWYHNDRMINYDVIRGVQVNSDAEKSILTIQEAQKSDSGNYTCVPSNARPSSISVHILNGEKPAAMQHGSRNHSLRLAPTCSASLLFVTAFVVFVLTTWLATTNLSQQNLYYLQHHQSQPERHKKKRLGYCSLPTTTNQTPPHMKLKKKKQENEKKTHQQNHFHHLYLQLLKEISEVLARKTKEQQRYADDDDDIGDERKSKENSADFNSDPICNDPDAFALTLCLLLLQTNRRAADMEYSRKSNRKKPQGKTCFGGSATQGTIADYISPGVSYRPPNTVIQNRYYFAMMDATLEYFNLRRVSPPEGRENGGKIYSVAAVAGSPRNNGDQHHNHEHMSLADGTDFKERSILALIIVMELSHCRSARKVKEHNGVPGKWDSWVVVDDQPIKAKFCDNSKRQKIPISLPLGRSNGAGQSANESLSPQKKRAAVLSTTLTLATADAAAQHVGGSRNINLSPQFSPVPQPSSSFLLLSRRPMTLPSVYQRFITSPDISSPTSSIINHDCYFYNGTPKVDTSGQPHEVGVQNSIVVSLVQVIIITRRREEADVSLEHRHHFSILFPSACSQFNNNSLTVSGLLLSPLPFLLLTSSVAVTPRRRTTTTTTSTLNTTSFQPLFCSRNKAEGEGCLPQLLVKRLPTTKIIEVALQQLYSENVPTTTCTTTTYHSSGNKPTPFDYSLLHTTSTTPLEPVAVAR